MSCSVMPRPRSSTSTTTPLATRSALTVTSVLAGEFVVAFSISSASRWITSATADPITASPDRVITLTLVKSSTSATAARSTSTTGTGWFQPRPGASPDRMIRPSACRRMRVVRWSSWNSSSSVPGSVELRSIWSSSASWRCSRVWLRQARLRKT